MIMFRRIEYLISKSIKRLHLRAIKNSSIHKTSLVYAGSQLVNVELGRYSDIGYDNTIINTKIGSFCAFGKNVIIGGANHSVNWVSISSVFNLNKDDFKKKFSRHSFSLESMTKVGNDVWIGDNAMIKAGVTINNGAIVGMGSVVTKDIPPYEIWAGNPAKCIKKRFTQNEIDELEKMQWWNWDDKTIEELAPFFNNLSALINKVKLNKFNQI
jgi:acetyltransferase-like isoleucine patch superfamily enzyme